MSVARTSSDRIRNEQIPDALSQIDVRVILCYDRGTISFRTLTCITMDKIKDLM